MCHFIDHAKLLSIAPFSDIEDCGHTTLMLTLTLCSLPLIHYPVQWFVGMSPAALAAEEADQ